MPPEATFSLPFRYLFVRLYKKKDRAYQYFYLRLLREQTMAQPIVVDPHAIPTHGSCRIVPPEAEEQSPYARLLPSSSHVYNPLAIALLAGPLGPMQSRGRNDRSLKPRIPSGFTFILQLIDHDLTEQVGNALSLGRRQIVSPEGAPTALNGKTGRLDLDSLYGAIGKQQLVDNRLFDERGHFILSKTVRVVHQRREDNDEENGEGAHGFSGPRDIERGIDFGTDTRRIADGRNDENKIVVQHHILFARLHNKLMEDHGLQFLQARTMVLLTWQRIIFADVLPRIVSKDVIEKVKLAHADGNTLYQHMNNRINTALPNVRHGDYEQLVAMPVEFAHAAFRFGHSMLRNAYRMNSEHALPLFTTFPVASSEDCNTNDDLRGHVEITEETEIDFRFFFGPDPQYAEPIDVKIPAALFRLPPVTGITDIPLSLPHRNILRGIDFGLPSGQEAAFTYAHVYGTFPLVKDLGIPKDVLDADRGLGEHTPLFYYVLREAEELNGNATQLGPLGSLIVGETLVGSLAASGFDIGQQVPDHRHYMKIPEHPITYDGIWTMVELLHYLGEL